MAPTREPLGFVIGEALGARDPAGVFQFVLFVPDKDKNGEPVDQHDYWVGEALAEFGKLFRGATAYPRARGVWRKDEDGGELLFENPTIVVCYAELQDVTRAAMRTLRRFLHRLGRETNQGEVGIVCGDEYWGITEFDD